MPQDETWVVVDHEGRTVGSSCYFSEAQVLAAIDGWLRRNERGGRPDLGREWILGLRPERVR